MGLVAKKNPNLTSLLLSFVILRTTSRQKRNMSKRTKELIWLIQICLKNQIEILDLNKEKKHSYRNGKTGLLVYSKLIPGEKNMYIHSYVHFIFNHDLLSRPRPGTYIHLYTLCMHVIRPCAWIINNCKIIIQCNAYCIV